MAIKKKALNQPVNGKLIKQELRQYLANYDFITKKVISVRYNADLEEIKENKTLYFNPYTLQFESKKAAFKGVLMMLFSEIVEDLI